MRNFRLPRLFFWLLFFSGMAAPAGSLQAANQIFGKPLEKTTGLAVSAPERVASINLCADQLLLLLAAPGQIASLSNLATDSSGSYYYQRAVSYPLNRGTAEQLVPLKPDLVIAGEYSKNHTVALLRELGIRVETLSIANSLPALMDNILQVAQWLGNPEQGESIVQELQQRLDVLPQASQQRPRVAVYDPNGYTVGEGTMRGQVLKLAGWHNVAEDVGISDYGRLSLEQLIGLAPDALFESNFSPGTYSRGQALSQHPALRKTGLAPIVMEIPSRMTICAGPWTLDVIEALFRQRQTLSRAIQ